MIYYYGVEQQRGVAQFGMSAYELRSFAPCCANRRDTSFARVTRFGTRGRKFYKNLIQRGVAQFGRALRSGRRSRKFESCHLDHKNKKRGLSSLFVFAIEGCRFGLLKCVSI